MWATPGSHPDRVRLQAALRPILLGGAAKKRNGMFPAPPRQRAVAQGGRTSRTLGLAEVNSRGRRMPRPGTSAVSRRRRPSSRVSRCSNLLTAPNFRPINHRTCRSGAAPNGAMQSVFHAEVAGGDAAAVRSPARPRRQPAAASRHLSGLQRADHPQWQRRQRARDGALGYADASAIHDWQADRSRRHNIRRVSSSHWRSWLGHEHRCLVPFTSLRRTRRSLTVRRRRSGSPSTSLARSPSSPASGAVDLSANSRRARSPGSSSAS